MTFGKEKQIQDVRNKIEEIRNILDDVMYGSPYISEKEYKPIREAYDLICKANDKL